jgi:UDP-N-acetylglucosamine 4,6-dehydratase
MFIAANNIRGRRDLRFSVVRYGNVMGSRGSVIPFFLDRARSGVLPITDPAMTRFNISLREGVEMVLWALENALGGELLVPKIPSYRITDVAEAIGPSCQKPIVDLGPYYSILPSDGLTLSAYQKSGTPLRPVPKGFAYNSGTNPEFLSVEQLRNLIRDHVDSSFQPL